jgi:hypothetical protein
MPPVRVNGVAHPPVEILLTCREPLPFARDAGVFEYFQNRLPDDQSILRGSPDPLVRRMSEFFETTPVTAGAGGSRAWTWG